MSYKKRTDLAVKQLGDQLVIIDSKVGKAVHRLNEVGIVIWDSLEQLSVEEIHSKIVHEFDVDPLEAREDLISFITELESKQLIEKSL